MSSWPLAGAMLITVLTALLLWNATQNALLTVPPTAIVGGLLTVRYGPSPSRVLAYALSLGVLTAAILAGWVLSLALTNGVTATPVAVLLPVGPTLIGVAVGIPSVAGGVHKIVRARNSDEPSRVQRRVPVRKLLIVAGLLTLLLAGGVAVAVYMPTTQQLTDSPESPSSSAGTGGAPYAGVSITQEQASDGSWKAEVYVYQMENTDHLTVASSDSSVEVQRAGETVRLTGLEDGSTVTVTVTREGTTKTVRTEVIGETNSS